MIGHTLIGFYEVKGDKTVRSVHCDFTKLLDQGARNMLTCYCFLVISYLIDRNGDCRGVVDVKSSPIYFHVQRNTTYSVTGKIPFQIVQSNVGGGMNITSGIFTAPQSGTYFFSFTGLKDGSDNALRMDLYCNSNQITRAEGAAGAGLFTATLSSTLSLKSGDQISLQLISGALFDGYAKATNFNGILLQEEVLL